MSEVQASGILDNVRLARWLLGHSDKVPVLIGYFDAYQAASTVRDKWYEGLRPTGDLLVDVIDTLPAARAGEVVALADVEAQALRLGIDWPKLLEAAQVMLPLVLEALLKLRS